MRPIAVIFANLSTFVLFLLLSCFGLSAYAQKKQGVEIIVISPVQEICMGAQKQAIEPYLSSRKIGDAKKWNDIEANSYLSPLIKKSSLPIFTPIIIATANESLDIVITGNPPSNQLALILAVISEKCITNIYSSIRKKPSQPPTKSVST